MKYLIILACLLINVYAISQELEYEKIDWTATPKWSSIDSVYSKEKEITLNYERIFEFVYSEKFNNNLVEYFTLHKKIKVLGDDAIQANNKVYIPMSNTLELIDARARVITPENKVVNFDLSNVKESENGGGYKYFAIDGAVIGSDIELTYTLLRIPSCDGRKITFQDKAPLLNVGLKLIAPSNLEFSFKSYNGFPEISADTSYKDKNYYKVHVDVIPGLMNESYSAYEKSLQQCVFKLDKNYATGKFNLYSFGVISQNFHGSMYGELDKSSVKKIKKFVTASGAFEATNVEKKIRLIEHHIKRNIEISEDVPSKIIGEMISDKIASENDILHLMIQSLKLLGVSHEAVITADRYEDHFDKDFEHYQVLKNVILYFPEINMYMSPEISTLRLGIIPSEYTNQYGLFIKEVEVGGMKTGLGKVKFIEPISSEKTKDLMAVNVDLSDIDEPIINFNRELHGYSSAYIQGVYSFLDDENRKELDENMIKFADVNGEVLNYSVSGISDEDCSVNPMVYDGRMKSSSLMEKAGNRYLFKVGQLIGAQAEMYQEKTRNLGIEHSHNMVYRRVITFDIPDNFDVSGLESLKIKEEYPKDQPQIMFISDYKIEGSKVEVIIVEEYKKMSFDKQEIDEFRRIINAAANFNKAVLFLTKK